MTKKKIIEMKEQKIADLNNEIDNIEKLEINRLYYFEFQPYSWQPKFQLYGVIETFNKESIRVRVIACNHNSFSDALDRWNRRRDITQIGYHCNPTPVSAHDLPLLVGMNWKSAYLEQIMKGETKVRMD